MSRENQAADYQAQQAAQCAAAATATAIAEIKDAYLNLEPGGCTSHQSRQMIRLLLAIDEYRDLENAIYD
jgi:hypothetical protein